MTIRIPATTIKIIKDGVTVEQVCFEHAFDMLGNHKRAGRLKGYYEATLKANPGIARLGLILPIGTRLNLPEFTAKQFSEMKRLWS